MFGVRHYQTNLDKFYWKDFEYSKHFASNSPMNFKLKPPNKKWG